MTPGKVVRYAREQGLINAVRHAVRRAFPERADCFRTVRPHLRGSRGLEIGGPSQLFEPTGLVPVYAVVGELDNVNMPGNTVWHGTFVEGRTFEFDGGRRRGNQFVREATDLSGVADESYDFLVSSHVLEHIANPLRALREWMRVVRPGGTLLLVVPHRQGTFDHRRVPTTLSHLIEDLERCVGEDDLTHVPEILAHHDLARDPGADPATFAQRCADNAVNRCLHHHVFDARLFIEVCDHVGLQLLAVEAREPCHIFAVARKPITGAAINNVAWTDANAGCLRQSPFSLDRVGSPTGA